MYYYSFFHITLVGTAFHSLGSAYSIFFLLLVPGPDPLLHCISIGSRPSTLRLFSERRGSIALQRYSRTRYRTLYSTFIKYVVLTRFYSVTKARPCTGRTLYKCLHEDLNLSKHINFFSFHFFSSRLFSFYSFFLFSRLFRSYDLVFKHRLHLKVNTSGYGPASRSLVTTSYSTMYPLNRYQHRRTY